ncbi:pre-mRNA-splicing factor Cwc24p [Monosporozyma servazzii]
MFKKRTRLSSGKDVKRRKLEVEHITSEAEHITSEAENKTSEAENKTSEVETIKSNDETIKSNDETTKSEDEVDKRKTPLSKDDKEVKPPTFLSSNNVSESDEEEEENGDNTITTFLNKRKQVGSSGQIKQSKNLHSTVLIDYQPDICKDYAKTGYCGYGDNCKFLHSREDFKSGWKINKDWIQEEDDDAIDERIKDIKDIPFKCVICEDDYKNPVVTPCEHYFCRKCFSQNIKDTGSSKCVICGENTHGTAKIASKLQSLLNR